MTDDLTQFLYGMHAADEQTKLASECMDHLTLNELEVILGIEKTAAMDNPTDPVMRARMRARRAARRATTTGSGLNRSAEGLGAQPIGFAKARAPVGKSTTHSGFAKTRTPVKSTIRSGFAKAKSSLGRVGKMLKKFAADSPAELPGTGNVDYVGDVNTGATQPPAWPRAAMGVDAAGRRATPAEEKKQDDTASPQHVAVKAAGFRSHLLLPAIYRGDAKEAKRGRRALISQGAISGDIKAHDDYISRLESKKKTSGLLAAVLKG